MEDIELSLRRIVGIAVEEHKSVNALAKASGVPQASLNDWINEKSGLTLTNVKKLCNYLGVGLRESRRRRKR